MSGSGAAIARLPQKVCRHADFDEWLLARMNIFQALLGVIGLRPFAVRIFVATRAVIGVAV